MPIRTTHRLLGWTRRRGGKFDRGTTGRARKRAVGGYRLRLRRVVGKRHEMGDKFCVDRSTSASRVDCTCACAFACSRGPSRHGCGEGPLDGSVEAQGRVAEIVRLAGPGAL